MEQRVLDNFNGWIETNSDLKASWNAITYGPVNVLIYSLRDGKINDRYIKDGYTAVRFSRNTNLQKDVIKRPVGSFKWVNFSTSWGGGAEYCHLMHGSVDNAKNVILNFTHFNSPATLDIELQMDVKNFSIASKLSTDIYISAFKTLGS